MSSSYIKTTQAGQFEALRVQGQPVTELWQDIQNILQTYAQQFPNAHHIFLTQPFTSAHNGTTDWYGPECSPISTEEQSAAKQLYSETRGYILQWAQQNSGRGIDPDIVALLPTALTIPDVDNLYHNTQGFLLTAWGHRAVSGTLGEGTLQGKASPNLLATTEKVQPSPDTAPPHPSATKEEPNQQQRTSQNTTNSRTTTQERIIILPWYRVWYNRWLAWFPTWSWFPIFTFGLPLFLLALTLGTPLGVLFWGFGLGWALLATLLIGFGLWLRRRWGWIFIILGIILLLWLLTSLLTGLFSARRLPDLPGFNEIGTGIHSIGGNCGSSLIPDGLRFHAPSPARSNAMNDLQRARSRGGNQGALEVSLSWNNPSDLDLHVQPPTGQEISFKTPSADGGRLDVDANADTITSPIVEHPIEHITWPTRPEPGTYKIGVVLFRMRSGNQPIPYHVTVFENGQPIQEYNSSTAPTAGGTQNFTFNLPPAASDPAAASPSPEQADSGASQGGAGTNQAAQPTQGGALPPNADTKTQPSASP